jgi:uncharacterized protein (TIGR02246 family)
MNSVSPADLTFAARFSAGGIRPSEFDHRAHLRLAYVHLATHGLDKAVATFREALLSFLERNKVDPGKFHETLTQAWLQAVWHFMHRFGDTANADDFLQKSAVLHDPKIMLTHYSRDVLFSEEARKQFVTPDLDPIPRGTAMQESSEQRAIRAVVAEWMAATKRGDHEAVLNLMTDDVVFLRPGEPPMNKAAFAEAARSQGGQHLSIDGVSDIQEIHVDGNTAYLWSHLTVTVTPPRGAPPTRRDGHTLTVFRKVQGRWLLARDANLLVKA